MHVDKNDHATTCNKLFCSIEQDHCVHILEDFEDCHNSMKK